VNELLVPLIVLIVIIVIVLVILYFMGVLKMPGAGSAAAPAAPTAPAAPKPAAQPLAAAPAAGPYGSGSAAPLADGSAPAGFTIKGNADSMLFHTTDSPYYGRTKAEAWFATEADAERAGFKRWDRKS
jgi:large subunit ribosomal protein L4